MVFDLTLSSGRKIELRAIHQWLTYEGLLEGIPFKDWNDDNIVSDQREALKYCSQGAEPFLIPPQRRDYSRTPGDMESNIQSGFYRGHEPEFLPEVTCIGIFRSHFPKPRDPNKDYSRLVIVWYQDEFGLPTDEQILAQMRSIDWDKYAAEVGY
jgi:hypothetical protein